jgi:hypothetical protein
VAVAGPDQLADRDDVVTLDGRGSSHPGGSALRYQWDQTYGRPVALVGARTATPTFTAPEGPAEVRFRLIVRDAEGRTRTDFVAVVVNGPPTAAAGPDRTVLDGATVTLTGTRSADPEGAPLTSRWAQVAGPAVTLVGAEGAVATFTAPGGPAELRFELTVTDPRGRTGVDGVTVTVPGPPDADAGADRTVRSGEVVALDGGASSSGRYQWTQTYGPVVALDSTTAVSPTFVAPAVTGTRQVRFRLIVRDRWGRSSTDFVHITVTP